MVALPRATLGRRKRLFGNALSVAAEDFRQARQGIAERRVGYARGCLLHDGGGLAGAMTGQRATTGGTRGWAMLCHPDPDIGEPRMDLAQVAEELRGVEAQPGIPDRGVDQNGQGAPFEYGSHAVGSELCWECLAGIRQ